MDHGGLKERRVRKKEDVALALMSDLASVQDGPSPLSRVNQEKPTVEKRAENIARKWKENLVKMDRKLDGKSKEIDRK